MGRCLAGTHISKVGQAGGCGYAAGDQPDFWQRVKVHHGYNRNTDAAEQAERLYVRVVLLGEAR